MGVPASMTTTGRSEVETGGRSGTWTEKSTVPVRTERLKRRDTEGNLTARNRSSAAIHLLRRAKGDDLVHSDGKTAAKAVEVIQKYA